MAAVGLSETSLMDAPYCVITSRTVDGQRIDVVYADVPQARAQQLADKLKADNATDPTFEAVVAPLYSLSMMLF